MHARRLWILLLLALIAAAIPLAAKTLTFDDVKCHIDVPDDWTPSQVDNTKAAYQNADDSKAFFLRVLPASDTDSITSDSFIKTIETSLEDGGAATITGRQHVSLGGVDAYAVDVNGKVNNGVSYARFIVTVTNGNIYALDISKFNANPADDDELNTIVASFGFPDSAPAPKKEESWMDKFGPYGGTLLGVALVFGLFRWITRGGRAKAP